MKRKLLSLLLALGLVIGMAAPAMAAEDEDTKDPAPQTETTGDTTKTEDPAAGEETPAEGEETPAEGEEAGEYTHEEWLADVQAAAEALYELGLFKGTGTDADGKPIFELEREATRAEAVTMLVRLLGQEKAAQAGTWEIPFTDVEDWAVPYVGYAYANGLTLGTSETTFGSEEAVSTAQYLTFVLRALGYSSETDFAWDASWKLTNELEITDYSDEDGATEFYRGDAAGVSFAALAVTLKDSEKTLAEVIDENLAAAETPAEGEEKPAEGEEKPAEGEEKPAEGEEKPAEGEEKPAEGEEKPAA